MEPPGISAVQLAIAAHVQEGKWGGAARCGQASRQRSVFGRTPTND
jgi:hypothetical protein